MRLSWCDLAVIPLAVGIMGLAGGAAHASSPPAAQTYSQIILNDNPVAYYRLEDAGTLMADSSGKNNNGSVTGKPLRNAKGLIYLDPNAATNFNGAGWGSAPDKSYLNFAGAGVSLEAWIKAPDSPDGQIINKSKFATTTGYTLNVYHGAIYFGGNKQLQVSYPWRTNQIYHIVAEADGSGQGAVYVNGGLAVSGAVSDTYDYTGSLTIGANANGGQMFNGTIDEVAIYNKPLSALTIQKHYAAGATPAPSALLVALGGAIPGAALLSRHRRRRSKS